MPESPLQIRSLSGNDIFVEPAEITANCGLEYSRLIIPIKLKLNPIKGYDNNELNFHLLDLKAELSLEEKHLKISDLTSGFYPYAVKHQKLNVIYRLEFPLDYQRISKIEEYRRHNLNIQINLNFTIGIYGQEYISCFEYSSCQLGLSIEQSHWVKNILPLLSFGDYFIIEIPKGDITIENAWNYILKAEDCYNMWDPKGAFANCREMGDLLDQFVKNKLSNSPNILKWERSYSKYSHFVSLFLHIEDPRGKKSEEKITITKNDTEHILINAKALLKYAEYLLRESS